MNVNAASSLTRTTDTPNRTRKRPAEDDDDAGEVEEQQEEPTPRGASSWGALSAQGQALGLRQATAATVSSSSTSVSRPSKRSRSPTKSTADLGGANIELRQFDTTLLPRHPCTEGLLEDIESALEGIETIPAAVAGTLTGHSKCRLSRFAGHQIDHGRQGLSDAAALREMEALLVIQDSARRCKLGAQSETAWNARVHDRLLQLAMETDATPDVQCFFATTAAIIPALLPRNAASGDAMGARMVDLCVTVDVGPPRLARRRLVTQPAPLQSLNQTMYQPLRFSPIAIAAETKPELFAETGESQLAIWTKAWLHRTRLLLASACGPGETASIPPMPLLLIRGHDWYLLFAWEEQQPEAAEAGADETDEGPVCVVLSELHIGSTRFVDDMYRLRKVLARLARWAQGPFRTWYIENVIS